MLEEFPRGFDHRIGHLRAQRLQRHGITTVRQLFEATALRLRDAWGSVVGERWYHKLRGSQQADYGIEQTDVKKSISHSHVLPQGDTHFTGVVLPLQ